MNITEINCCRLIERNLVSKSSINNCPNNKVIYPRYDGLREILYKYGQKLADIIQTFTLHRGEVVYRIRKDYSKVEANPFDIPPRMYQGRGRFDYHHNILYVGRDISILEDECHVAEQPYYLLRYQVNSDFDVGSTIVKDTGDINASIIMYFYNLCHGTDPKYLSDENNQKILLIGRHVASILTPYQIGQVLGDSLYDYTNAFGDMLLAFFPNGLRYCSCHQPMEFQDRDTIFTCSDEDKINCDMAKSCGTLFALTKQGSSHLSPIGSPILCHPN